jgi:hypothetical protein
MGLCRPFGENCGADLYYPDLLARFTPDDTSVAMAPDEVIAQVDEMTLWAPCLHYRGPQHVPFMHSGSGGEPSLLQSFTVLGDPLVFVEIYLLVMERLLASEDPGYFFSTIF